MSKYSKLKITYNEPHGPDSKLIFNIAFSYEYVDESSVEEIKYGNEDETEHELWKKSEEALAQIAEKKYRTGIRTTKLVECGIAFQGKRAYVLSRVLRKERDQWVEDS